MPRSPGTTNSIAGVRSVLYVASKPPFFSRSDTSVGTATSGSESSGGITIWPWAPAGGDPTRESFDDRYNTPVPTASIRYLPVNSVTFKMGEESYLPTDDGVPGTSRVRRKCSGSYSFETSFPIMVSGDAYLNAMYANVLGAFLKNDPSYSFYSFNYPRMSSISMATSQQISGLDTKMYPCVLDHFSIEVNGIGQQGNAPPVSCRMTTRGVSYQLSQSMEYQVNESFPKDPSLGMNAASGYTRDGRIVDWDIRNSLPTVGGGRQANIKDCTVRLDGTLREQVVKMSLTIQHKLDLVSHSEVPNWFAMHLVNHAQSVYLTSRVVTGSFSFLASNIVGGVSRTSGFSVNSELKPTLGNLRADQWSSPLYMSFGPLEFNMRAVYWQPIVQEMTPGSSLVTVNFLARSDIVGGTEFS